MLAAKIKVSHCRVLMEIMKNIMNICGKDYDRKIEEMDKVKIVSKKRYGFKN